MEFSAFVNALDKIGPYGVPGIMALLFYVIIRAQAKTHAQSLETQERAYLSALEQHQKVLEQYKGDLSTLSKENNQTAKEMRQMYDNNVKLVELYGRLLQRYAERSEYIEKLIQNNIQCWQTAIQKIDDNQFCPRMRELGGKA